MPVHFAVIGGGPEQEALESHVRELGLDSMITFAGKKPADQIPSYYHCADAFVSASLTETQGMTYIEALASELPVFARPDEVLEDLVLEGQTGFLFKKPEQFAEKVQLFLAMSAEERAAMKLSLIHILPASVKKIAVLDRTKEMGAREPLYLDVLAALKGMDLTIIGGRYGLSSRDTQPNQIKAVYDELAKDCLLYTSRCV